MLYGANYPRHYPGMGAVFRDREGIVRDVDTRRRVPRTDLLLADPRLADAERRLGRTLVKAAVSRDAAVFSRSPISRAAAPTVRSRKMTASIIAWC